jgi:hypothetical protein
MNQSDPEQRIAELERQIAAARAGTHASSAANVSPAGPTAQMPHPGYFQATTSVSPRMSNKRTMFWWLLMIAVLMSMMVGYGMGLFRGIPVAVIMAPLYIAPFAFMFFQMRGSGWMSPRKPLVITLTGDGLTIDRRPGEVFAYGDLTLGLWNSRIFGGVTQGTALHLQSGSHHFVIGADGHRLATGTRFDAPPTEYPNATMEPAEFDQLLAMVSPRCALGVRWPAPGEPTRCLLIPCPSWFFPDKLSGVLSSFSNPFKMSLSDRSLSAEPSLVIDVNDTTTWVIDPKTNTVLASAHLAHVQATPATHVYYWKSGMQMPVMVVNIPGLQERLRANRPLTISCRDNRFSWLVGVPNEPAPSFVVGAADWRTLAEKFGLAPYMNMSSQMSFSNWWGGRRVSSGGRWY